MVAASQFVFACLLILSISSIVSGIECPVCTNVPGIGAGKCDSGKVPKVTCPDGWNQCMSLKGKMTVLGITQSIELKNCSNNIWCDSASDYNGCKLLNVTGFVTSCSLNCITPDTSGEQELASSLKCQACGPGDVPCDGSNVRSIQCDDFADRCMTTKVTTNIPNLGPYTSVMKNCSHSTEICKESGDGYPCRKSLLPEGANCTVTCCKGDMCNQLSSEQAPTKPSTAEPVTKASSLKCQACGPGDVPCDGSNARSIECDTYADRCMTVTMTMNIPNLGPYTTVVKNCSHSTMICKESGVAYPCQKNVLSQGANCTVTCCKGDMCNQQSSEDATVSPTPKGTESTTTEPVTKASSLKCQACGVGDVLCDGSNARSIECDAYADRCMTTTVTIGPYTSVLKNCSHSKINCEESGVGYPCRNLSALPDGANCTVTCCNGDMCNQESSEQPSTAEPVTKAFNIKCPVCTNIPHMGARKCDSYYVESKTCPMGLDKCMTVTGQVKDVVGAGVNFPTKFEVKNCSNSLLCEGGSDLNMCKILNSTGLVKSCSVKCVSPTVTRPSLAGGPKMNFTSVTPQVPETSNIKCPVCTNIPHMGASKCDSLYVESKTCPIGLDRCMTVAGKAKDMVGAGANFPTKFELTNCSNSFLCEPGSDYNMCKILNSTGLIKSCSVKCVSPIGTRPSIAGGPKINFTSITPQVPETSNIKCPVCTNIPHMGARKCDSYYVESKTCPIGLDKCMTVEGQIKDVVGAGAIFPTKFEIKNCSNSLLCEPGSDYNMCKILNSTGLVKSCSVKCVSPTVTSPSGVGGPKINSTWISVEPQVPETGVFKLNHLPVCSGTKGDQFGKFYVPSSGKLASLRLVHLYGYVSCHQRSYGRWSYWGCASSKINIVVTNSTNHVILPADQFISGETKWSKIPGYTSLSPQILLSVFSDPVEITAGEELRLWYGEDLANKDEDDNEGKVCADVYGLYV